MSRVIEVTVSAAGQSTVHTKGFAGGDCRQASQFLEMALGQHVREQLTSEFHQTLSNPAIHEQQL